MAPVGLAIGAHEQVSWWLDSRKCSLAWIRVGRASASAVPMALVPLLGSDHDTPGASATRRARATKSPSPRLCRITPLLSVSSTMLSVLAICACRVSITGKAWRNRSRLASTSSPSARGLTASKPGAWRASSPKPAERACARAIRPARSASAGSTWAAWRATSEGAAGWAARCMTAGLLYQQAARVAAAALPSRGACRAVQVRRQAGRL
ncbi:hypothetical protein D9M72_337290 [compost metagenome]